MAWSKRAPERIYAIVMWIVSFVLTGFLIGLGGLIIGDLPRVEQPVQLAQFVDPDALADIETAEEENRAGLVSLRAEQRTAQERLQTDQGNYAAEYEQFQNWLATRRATTDPAQDPAVIARTNALDLLKQREREAERAVETLAARERDLQVQMAGLQDRRRALNEAAFPAFERAQFGQELRVFLFRLAVTLPLLVVAFWMAAKKRKSRYWPLMRGFVLFAGFAFFVELVPYLPSYGGYIRYGVGILLTLVVGHYVIKWMRGYLDSRREAERLSEDQRRKSVAYEDALKKIGDNTCPGCDRKIMTTDDAVADYCVHCGMHLYDNCASCNSRKVSFYKFCMVCGAPRTEEPAAA